MGIGRCTGLVVADCPFAQWYAHNQREARREDRRLDLLEAQMRRAALAPGPAAEEKPARYDQARAGQPAEMPAAAPEVNVEMIDEQ